MKPLLLALLLTFAQVKLPIYGTPEELRDLTKVYVTADEPISRDRILSVLKKYDGLTVVNDPDKAEFILESTVRASTESRGLQSSHYARTLLTAYRLEGERKRILWSEDETIEERSGLTFSRPNDVNLARHFVDLLNKLRKPKK